MNEREWRSEVEIYGDEVTRVRNGLAFLEEKYGPDWVDMFTEEDMKNFDLKSGSCCVLGTLYNKRHKLENAIFGPDPTGYAMEASRLGLTNTEAVRLGFYTYERERWPTLTEQWRAVISARKAIKKIEI